MERDSFTGWPEGDDDDDDACECSLAVNAGRELTEAACAEEEEEVAHGREEADKEEEASRLSARARFRDSSSLSDEMSAEVVGEESGSVRQRNN